MTGGVIPVGRISAEEVLFRAMIDIANLSANIYTSNTADWQRNALNYAEGVKNLESLAKPFLPPDHEERVAAALDSYRGRYRSMTAGPGCVPLLKRGRDLDVKVTLRAANARLRLIQLALHDGGLFGRCRYQVIRDGPGEEQHDEE